MPQWLNFSDILNISITASWLVLAVLILRLLLKKAPKWTHVALWGLVAVRLLLPFSIESIFSLIPSTETVPSEILSHEGGQLTQPGRLDIVTNPAFSEEITIELPQTVDRVQQRTVDFTVIWLAGAAAVGLYAIVSYWRVHRKVRTAVRMEKGIYQSEAVASPFVLGIIHPRIYLPFAMAEPDMAHVIAHERAHIRRKDHWWKPLGFALLAVHWFNPVMWLAYILLCRDIELACDEKVIKELGTEQRADYSQALLSCAVHHRMIAACPLAFGEVGVKERVKSVLNYKKPAFWIIIVAVIACVVAAVCFLTDPPEQEQEPPRDRLAVGDYIPVREIYISLHSGSEPLENYRYTVAEDYFHTEHIPAPSDNRYMVDWGWRSMTEAEENIAFLKNTDFYMDHINEHSLYQYVGYRLHIIQTDGKLYLINGSNDAADHEKLRYIYQIVPKDHPVPDILLSGTEQLTLYDLIDLSEKGDALRWHDLAPYQCTDVGLGICIFRYQIDSFFYLDFSLVPTGGDYPETATEQFILHHISGNFMDIRMGDVRAFIYERQHIFYPYFLVEDNTLHIYGVTADTLLAYGWETLNIPGTVLHGSSANGLTERFEKTKQTIGILPSRNRLTLNFRDEVPLKITWKTYDPYNTSTSGSIDAPTNVSTIVLGANMGLPLASNLENIPPRKVQILCQYKDRTVEYLLIIASNYLQ